MKRELYIIRHGETDFNIQGIVQGRGVDTSLNETGKKQAQLFYNAFQHEGFEIIFSSSLKRTHETVAPFVNDGIEWEEFSELDEINWGIFEGKRATRDFKHEYYELLKHWEAGVFTARIENGESPLEVKTRQQKFIRLWEMRKEKKTLMCMHGRALRILLAWLVNDDLKTMDTFPHHNVTLYKLIFDEGRYSIELFNYTKHLHATT